jgi:CubicO group peptidase (beta-lactamase class C family)
MRARAKLIPPAAFVAAALAILATAAAAQDEGPPPRVSAVPIPPAQIEQAIGQVDAIVEDVMQRTGIPGVAVAVVHGGKPVLVKGYGVREAGKPETVGPDTVFQLASVSKSVGATVLAREVGDGKVAWDTRVQSLLPWFELGDPAVSQMLTIGDLYAHRSGLPDHGGDDLEDLGYGRREIMERLRLLPLGPFRVSYAYTNFGPTSAAEAVATAAGTDWATLSETALYRPLGMTRTSSRFSDYIAASDRAVPHMRTNGAWRPDQQRQPDAQSPAGGVSSTARDMAAWLAMLLADGSVNGQPLIAPEALNAALMPQVVSAAPATPEDRAGFYGFGFNVGTSPSGRVTLGHSGGFYLGAGTNFLLIPSADVGIVVLTNAQPIGAAEAITTTFGDWVQFGRSTRDWFAGYEPRFAPISAPLGHLVGAAPPADAAPAGDLEAYEGVYDNPYFGPIQVSAQGDGLVLTAGPELKSFPLTHWSGASFVMSPRSENAPEGTIAEVRFSGPDEKRSRVTVELWDAQGLGSFTRR